MILSFPTGFFDTVLPKQPADGGNVTYTVSNQLPPREPLVFVQIPPGHQTRLRGPRFFSKKQRRAVLSNLVFTISRGSNSIAGNNTKQFEVGQILQFAEEGTELEIVNVAPILVQNKTETRSDTNLLDLGEMGLNDDEIESLEDQSSETLDQLVQQLNQIREERDNTDLKINENQKRINETQKAILAIDVVVVNITDSTEFETTRKKLEDNLQQLITERNALIAQADQLAAQATAINNQIIDLSQLVR